MSAMTSNTKDCPKCEQPMERREGMFYWRGDYKPGWVCVSCNALWSIKGEEIAPLVGNGL